MYKLLQSNACSFKVTVFRSITHYKNGMAASQGHPTLHSPQTQIKDDHGKASVMSPPSRTLPQRAWAASTPTLLSHDAFDNLLKQPPYSNCNSTSHCRHYRKLGSLAASSLGDTYIVIGPEKHLTSIQAPEQGVNMFKAETLQFRVSLNTSTLQSLRLKIVSLFQMPNQDRNLKLSVKLLLTVPQANAHMAPAGCLQLSIVVVQKMILMLPLTRINAPVPQQQAQQQQQQPGPQSITIPLLYIIQENINTLVEKGPTLPNVNLQQVSQHMKRFMERFHPNMDCAIYPAVRELLTNLVLA